VSPRLVRVPPFAYTTYVVTTILANNDASGWAAVGLLLLIATSFALAMLLLTHIVGPSRKGEIKGLPYESGMNPIGSARQRFNVRFYLLAITFLLFDVEIVFLYPWAITFPSLGETEAGQSLAPLFLLRMLFFIGTSIVAFLYAWRKGVFRYD